MVSGSHGKCVFDFIWNCQTFPELYSFASPPTMYRSSTCSSFLLPHGIVFCIYFDHSNRYLWYLLFSLHFSSEWWCCLSFKVLIYHWSVLFGVGLDLVAIFKNCFVYFLIFELWKFFTNSEYKSFTSSSFLEEIV